MFDATTECSSFKCSPEGEDLLLKVHAGGGMWGGPILGLRMPARFMYIMYNSACVSHTNGKLCHKRSMWDGVHFELFWVCLNRKDSRTTEMALKMNFASE